MGNLFLYSSRLNGAKIMLHYLNDSGRLNLVPGISKKDGSEVYHKAVFDWLMSDLRNIEHFLSGEPFYFTDHKKDCKGKLLSCKIKVNRK